MCVERSARGNATRQQLSHTRAGVGGIARTHAHAHTTASKIAPRPVIVEVCYFPAAFECCVDGGENDKKEKNLVEAVGAYECVRKKNYNNNFGISSERDLYT